MYTKRNEPTGCDVVALMHLFEMEHCRRYLNAFERATYKVLIKRNRKHRKINEINQRRSLRRRKNIESFSLQIVLFASISKHRVYCDLKDTCLTTPLAIQRQYDEERFQTNRSKTQTTWAGLIRFYSRRTRRNKRQSVKKTERSLRPQVGLLSKMSFLVFITVNWNAISWFLSKPDHSSWSRMLTIDSWKKTLLWPVFMSAIWLVSFSPQASFESVYTSSESPVFSLSNDIFKCSSLFSFRFFLRVTMLIVEDS